MGQLWKVKRELARFGQQLRSIPEFFYEPFLRKFHDLKRSRFTCVDGNIPQTNKVAIVLLYQPNGLGADVIGLLQIITSKGFAPLVINNSKLSPADEKVLENHCWRRVDRPNFGYDFGGYRDGILHLLDDKTEFTELLILNDSVMFTGSDVAKHLVSDLPAKALTGGILRERGSEHFLESYFYRIPRMVFDDASFIQYWRHYELTNNKYKVIRRGERGFSAAMLQAGIALNPLFDHQSFIAKLKACSANELEAYLNFASYRSDADMAKLDELLRVIPKDDAWCDLCIEHVSSVLSRDVFNSAYPVAAVKELAFPFLKKSNEPVNKNWRNKYLAAVEQSILDEPESYVLDFLENERSASLKEQ